MICSCYIRLPIQKLVQKQYLYFHSLTVLHRSTRSLSRACTSLCSILLGCPLAFGSLCFSKLCPSIFRIWRKKTMTTLLKFLIPFYFRDGACVDKILDHGADVYGLTAHPNRPFVLASCARDSTLRIWSLTPLITSLQMKTLAMRPLDDVISATGKMLLKIKGHVQTDHLCWPLVLRTSLWEYGHWHHLSQVCRWKPWLWDH